MNTIITKNPTRFRSSRDLRNNKSLQLSPAIGTGSSLYSAYLHIYSSCTQLSLALHLTRIVARLRSLIDAQAYASGALLCFQAAMPKGMPKPAPMKPQKRKGNTLDLGLKGMLDRGPSG